MGEGIQRWNACSCIEKYFAVRVNSFTNRIMLLNSKTCFKGSINIYSKRICFFRRKNFKFLTLCLHIISCFGGLWKKLNRIFARPKKSTFLENGYIATMVINRGECIASHISPCLSCARATLSVDSFQSKQNESWTHVNLLLRFGLGFDPKQTTETHGDLHMLPQQWKKEHNHMSHALLLQRCVGTCKNSRSPKQL